ncbi:MAG: Hsp70 family protein [Verrucomicrobiales bacterium]|nr:Hsp70 family protein [Verrucomicrobiales bacterium]
MSKIVGIDLGTTNSLVATVDSGIPYVIADASGRRLTPSVVHLGAAGQPVVGFEANRARALHPRETVYSVKRFMGRRGADIPREDMLVTYPVQGTGAGPVTIPVRGREWTPEEVSAEILRKLKTDAETALGVEVTRAVITVPAYFNDAQRHATIRAGELAGLKVERIINEPTAAALAYGLNKLQDQSKIAVFDLGGGTFDLTLLELNQGVFQVLSTHGNTRLGGDDLDTRLTEFLAVKIHEAGGPDLRRFGAAFRGGEAEAAPTPEDLQRIARVREAAEKSKISLSLETLTDVTLPFLTPQFSFRYQLSRSELEALTRDILLRTRTHCLQALADAKVDASQLDQVVLVGGQTRMPLVRALVTEWFGCREFEESRGDVRLGEDYHRPSGPLLNTGVNPDEAVALGAAIQAEILSGGMTNLLLLDVTPLSLGIETFGGLMNVIIPRNSTIPVKAGEVFTTAVDRQRSMLIHVLQGERERARDNWSLGRFDLDFEEAPKGVPRVGVQFEIDANGILHVLARDLKTGHQRIVDMKSAVDVSDADVQKMIEESVEHAFDDLKARQWIEAKVRAGETLAATRKGLAEHGAELDEAYRRRVETAMQAVEAALETEESRTRVGDAARLKGANQGLDEATLQLAELMMDRAMEEMLRKQGMIQ